MAYFNTDFLKQKLKKIRDSKTSVPDITDILKEEQISELIKLSSIEYSFGKFSNEIDNYFTTFPITDKKTEVDIILSELSTSSIANYFLYRKEATFNTDLAWQWLDKLMYCVKRHITSAGEYHQFTEKIGLCKEGIKSIYLCLKSIFERLPNISLDDVNIVLKECLLIILSIVDIAEDIFTIHKEIIPVCYRVCNGQRMKAKLLIDCSISNIDLVEGDEVAVTNKNFENNIWTVERVILENDEETITTLEIPSLFLILDSKDPGITKKCHSLKKQLSETWKSIISHFETFIVSSTNSAIAIGTLSKNTGTNQYMCHSVLDALINSLNFDISVPHNIDSILHLRRHLEDDSILGSDGSVDNWSLLNETVQLFNDTKLYFTNFEEILLSNSLQEECNIVIGNPKYVTMAYIYKLSEKVASEMELVSQPIKSVENISDISINLGTGVHSVTEEKDKSSKNNYKSNVKLYFHESSIFSKIPTKTICKPNVFSAHPTIQENETDTIDLKNKCLHGDVKEFENVKSTKGNKIQLIMENIQYNVGADNLNNPSDGDVNPRKENVIEEKEVALSYAGENKDSNSELEGNLGNEIVEGDDIKVKDTSNFLNSLESSCQKLEKLKIFGAVNTDNGSILGLEIAKELNIIDKSECKYHDIVKDNWMPIRDAILAGLVILELLEGQVEVCRVLVEWVKIGKEQKKVDLKVAILEGYINPFDSTYKIEEENIKMRSIEAIMCGMMKIKQASVERNVEFENFLVVHRSECDPNIDDLCKLDLNKELNVKMLSIIQLSDCWNAFLDIDDHTESCAKGIYNDHIEVDPLRCDVENKDNLFTAYMKGHMQLPKVLQLLENMKGVFVGEVLEDVDTRTSGKDLSNKLNGISSRDRKDLFMMECENIDIMSAYKLDNDMDEKLFITRIDAKKIEIRLKQLRTLEDVGLDTSRKAVMGLANNSCTFDSSTIVAVMNDVLLMDTLEIQGRSGTEICGLETAVKAGLIDRGSVEYLLKYAEMLNFDRLIQEGLFDVVNNSFGEEATLARAIDKGNVDPNLVYLFWPAKKAFVNLSNLIKVNILDPELNQVTIENGQKEIVTMKLSEAINPDVGVFVSKIDANGMTETMCYDGGDGAMLGDKCIEEMRLRGEFNLEGNEERLGDDLISGVGKLSEDLDEEKMKGLNEGDILDGGLDSRIRNTEGDNVEFLRDRSGRSNDRNNSISDRDIASDRSSNNGNLSNKHKSEVLHFSSSLCCCIIFLFLLIIITCIALLQPHKFKQNPPL